jgi:hypothetical protein
MERVFEEVLEWNKLTAIELINTFDKRGADGIIFPNKWGGLEDSRSQGVARISEQELRFVMVRLFSPKETFNQYSVETPTSKLYNFKDEGDDCKKRSASIDLSLYKDFEKVLNIEFKSLNPEKKSYSKDIQKIVRENCLGAWCHLLHKYDNGTFNNIISNKLNPAIKEITGKVRERSQDILFTFIVLEKKEFFWVVLEKGDENLPDIKEWNKKDCKL